jgi:1-aminocyclopropane-1-carboxylate deaminase/D-cysteine desulfhydrase-like pyridoxal-dependent ACC family enzyme
MWRLSCSSGGTQVGLVLGFKQLKLPLTLIGTRVLSEKSEAINVVVN